MSFAIELPRTVWERFTSRRAEDYSRIKLVLWWEHRRLYFNVLLLCVGLLSIFIFEWIGGIDLRPGEDVIEPMALITFVPLFALCANACYTLGWLVDLITNSRRPSTRLATLGFIFSVLMTLVPALYIILLHMLHKVTGPH